jgi:threonine/homoserine/homoserine lactone efflux protein
VAGGGAELFLQGAWLGLSAAAAPGPLQAYLLAQSARNGAARTLPLVCVPLVTDPPLIAIVLAVLAQVPAGLLRALGIAGGAIVLWLGIGALAAARRARGARGEAPGASGPPAEGRAPPKGFVRAMALNFTNPNAWLWWSGAAGPILAAAWRASPLEAGAFLGGFYLLLLAGNATVVLLSARIARAGPAVARGLGALSGAALVAFGTWQLAKGLLGA